MQPKMSLGCKARRVGAPAPCSADYQWDLATPGANATLDASGGLHLDANLAASTIARRIRPDFLLATRLAELVLEQAARAKRAGKAVLRVGTHFGDISAGNAATGLDASIEPRVTLLAAAPLVWEKKRGKGINCRLVEGRNLSFGRPRWKGPENIVAFSFNVPGERSAPTLPETPTSAIPAPAEAPTWP